MIDIGWTMEKCRRGDHDDGEGVSEEGGRLYYGVDWEEKDRIVLPSTFRN